MRKVFFLSLALALWIWGPWKSAIQPAFSGAPGWTLDPAQMKAGVVLGMYSQERGFDYEGHLEEIRDLGATWVQLLVTQWQTGRRSSCIAPDAKKTPHDEEIAQAIRQAHALGLKVMLFPIVLLAEPGPKDWRGNLKPARRAEWFASYRAMLLHYAQLADQEGAEALSIGSELATMEKYDDFWKELIQSVRANYTGLVLYSANWDHFEHASWFNELDLIGISAYFSVSSTTMPTLKEIVHSWLAHEEKLRAWQKTVRPPLLFTELGYPSVDGAGQNPWNYELPGPVDLQEQALCYEAFRRVWTASDLLSGVFFYEWWERGGPEDRSYTPRGKPAEAILRQTLAELKLSFDGLQSRQ